MKLFAADAPRLSVEPIAPRHAAAVQHFAADARLAATTRLPHPYPEDGARAFVARAQQAWTEGRDYVFAVCFDDDLVGTCGLKTVHVAADGHREAELGYWIGLPFWGRGYASAAARLVSAFGFETLALSRITAHVLARNPASARVLEKSGFDIVGEGIAPADCGEEGDAVVYYALTAEAWQASG